MLMNALLFFLGDNANGWH